jgi:VWFA-related protein
MKLQVWIQAMALTVSLLPPRAPQSRQESLRLEATLIQVPTVVTDRKGRFIADLAPDDFLVFDDGKRQDISLFEVLKLPLNLALVLDTSNSAEDRLGAIREVAMGFARQMREGDRAVVITFDHEVRAMTDMTSDRAQIESAIKMAEAGFGKLLYEAVARALNELRSAQGRRAVILLSDGVDMDSIEATAESTLRLAEEVGAVIYTIRFDTRWWVEARARQQRSQQRITFGADARIPLPPDFGGPGAGPSKPRIEIGPKMSERDEIAQGLDQLYGKAEAYLQALAERTGGRAFQAESFDATRSAFAQIIEELRNQYLLGYYAAPDRRPGQYYKIKVEVKKKDLQVRARPGYRVPPQQREAS